MRSASKTSSSIRINNKMNFKYTLARVLALKIKRKLKK